MELWTRLLIFEVEALQAPPIPSQVGLPVKGDPARSEARPGLCKPWAVSSFLFALNIFNQNYFSQGFPGGPVVNTLFFQCRVHRFNPWSWN